MNGSIKQEDWQVAYTGYGNVSFTNGAVLFAPEASTSPGQTHSVLINSTITAKSFHLTIVANTIKQLRQNSQPNPWEVFWIFFNYVPVGAVEKNTNYLTLKTNGIELGTANASVGQQFLYTCNTPKITLDTNITYDLIWQNNLLEVNINNVLAFNFNNSKNQLYNVPGSIGLYCEDSKVLVSNVTWISYG